MCPPVHCMRYACQKESLRISFTQCQIGLHKVLEDFSRVLWREKGLFLFNGLLNQVVSTVVTWNSYINVLSKFKLPYFDPIRMTIIDHMHNLYLGTAKRILKVWIEQNLINTKQFDVIQGCVDSVRVPAKLGRIPSKIASSFSSFIADQFKNWTNIYSLFALHDILSPLDFECWRHFVLASRLLNQMLLSLSDIQLADALLLQFCKWIEHMYGTVMVLPNMHAHAHALSSEGVHFGLWIHLQFFCFFLSNTIMEILKVFQQTAVRLKCNACRGLYASLL